jgi:hypothetical protein
MFTKTKLYTVLIKRNSAEPLKDAEFVRSGFNIWAFLFSSIWALFNRLWLVFFLLLGLEALNFYLPNYLLINTDGLDLLIIVIHILLGFEGNDLKIKNLQKKGYFIFDVTSGIDDLEAERRFFDKYLMFSQSLIQQSKTI